MEESRRSKINRRVWKFSSFLESCFGLYLLYLGCVNVKNGNDTKAIALTKADYAGSTVKVSDMSGENFKAYLNIGTEFDQYLNRGYITAWGGLITLLIGLIGFIMFIRKRTNTALAWSRSLAIYPLMFILCLYLISKYPDSTSVLISLFAAIITTSATIKLWEQLCEQVFTAPDANKIGESRS